MKTKVSSATLAVLGSLLSQGTSADEIVSVKIEDARVLEAAEAITELKEAGYITVNPRTGTIKLEKSVLEILKESGLAKDKELSTEAAAGCSRTTGVTDDPK